MSSITLELILSQVQVDVALGRTPKSGPPGFENGPLGFSGVAVHSIFDIALTMFNRAMVVQGLEPVVTAPAIGVNPTAWGNVLEG